MDPLEIYTPYVPGDWPETWVTSDNQQPEWKVSALGKEREAQ